MDELVDILDETGKPTGQKLMKSEAHSKGLFHPTVHIWFYTGNGKILLQQRARTKDTHPLLWDVSVAGHIEAGEPILQAAVREIKEEIGLVVVGSDLDKIGVFKSVHHHSARLIDCEFHHSYICQLNVPFNKLKKQKNEVEALTLKPLIQFAEEVWGKANPSQYVPHSTAYYKAVIKAIKQRL